MSQLKISHCAFILMPLVTNLLCPLQGGAQQVVSVLELFSLKAAAGTDVKVNQAVKADEL